MTTQISTSNAFSQGYMAYYKGQAITTNPFVSEKDPVNFNEWDSGWIAAEKDAAA